MSADINDKAEIWLTDLYHQQQPVQYFPIGIGYVASYAQKIFPDRYSFRLFTDPDKFARECHRRKPLIVGMRNDLGNTRLSYDMIVRLKKRHPDTITVMGGPNYPIDSEKQAEFLKTRPLVDFFVFRDGEVPFSKLLEHLESVKFDVAELKRSKADIPGCYYLSNGHIVAGEMPPRVSPDEIPSPYLTGLLDHFFEEKLIPSVQTTRGCPFSCAYCTEGNPYFNKVRRFSLEQLEKEMRYIVARTKEPSGVLLIVDTNFGMYKQDIEVAKMIAAIQKEEGWPRRIYGPGAGKNKKENVLTTYRQFAPGTCMYSASIQSAEPEVLKNIKRKNISITVLTDIAREAEKNGWSCYTELILGLPGDSKAAHLNSLRMTIEAEMREIVVYSLYLLPGSEIDAAEYHREFQIIPRFAIPRKSMGEYQFGQETFPSAEIAELGVVNSTMTFEDYLWCRMFDLSMMIFYSNGYFSEAEVLLKRLGLSVFDFLEKCHSCVSESDALTQFYADIQSYIEETTWETREEVEAFVADRTKMAEYAAMEYKQRFEIARAVAVIRYGEQMHRIARKALTGLLDEKGMLNQDLRTYIDELFRFTLYRKNELLNTELAFEDEFQFDFAGLHRLNFQADPRDFSRNGKQKLRFAHNSRTASKIRKMYGESDTSSVKGMENIVRYVQVAGRLDSYFRDVEVVQT